MVRTQERTETNRQKEAAAAMSPLKQMQRALSSGALKSEFRTIHEAINAARLMSAQIVAMAKRYDVKFKSEKYGDNFHVAVAFLTPDLTTLNTWPYTPGQETETYKAISGQNGICVALIFEIADAKEKLMGARPFLITPLVMSALKERMKETLGGD
jgi:hypothetical protein